MYKAGDTLGGCKLLKECGKGSFGSVFLAKNLTTDQPYALKILYKQGNHFERELAGLTAYQEKCRHTSLMRIYHADQNDECIFYTMDAADTLEVCSHSAGNTPPCSATAARHEINPDDYVPDTLGNRLRKWKRLPASELRPMLDELLNGLEILHEAGLLHRDIKPDNILWVNGHAVLGDIGLVTQGINASMAGTPGFISPEVWNGKRDFEQRDDLYALAMTLYCALSGGAPKDYPDLPLSLTLGSGRDLIRAYNAVLAPDSEIRTVVDWRNADKRLSRTPTSEKSTRLYWLTGIGLLAILLLLSLRFLRTEQPHSAEKGIIPENNLPQGGAARPPGVKLATPTGNTPPPSRPAVMPQKLPSTPAPVVAPLGTQEKKTTKNKKKYAPFILPPTPNCAIPYPELPPVPPMPKNYDEVEMVKAAGKILWQKYHDKVARLREAHPESPQFSALSGNFSRLKDRINDEFRKRYSMTLFPEGPCIFPLSENIIETNAASAGISGKKFDRSVFEKEYAARQKTSQSFLMEYSLLEQTVYYYISVKEKEESARFCFASDSLSNNPDTPSNRAAYKREFEEWHQKFLIFLQVQKSLEQFPLKEIARVK